MPQNRLIKEESETRFSGLLFLRSVSRSLVGPTPYARGIRVDALNVDRAQSVPPVVVYGDFSAGHDGGCLCLIVQVDMGAELVSLNYPPFKWQDS